MLIGSDHFVECILKLLGKNGKQFTTRIQEISEEQESATTYT